MAGRRERSQADGLEPIQTLYLPASPVATHATTQGAPEDNGTRIRFCGASEKRAGLRLHRVSVESIWAIILSVAFVKWLRGKVLDPVVEGDQILLLLTS